MTKYSKILPISLFLFKDQFILLCSFKTRISKTTNDDYTLKKQADLRFFQIHLEDEPTLDNFVNCVGLGYFLV